MTASKTAADSYGLVVPSDWNRVPLDDEGYRHFCHRALANLSEIDGWTRANDRQMEVLFAQVRNDLETGNVKLAALVADAEMDDEGTLVMSSSSVTVSRLGRSDLGSDLPLSADLLVRALGQEPRSEGGLRYTNLEAAVRTDLPAGPAARVRRVYHAGRSSMTPFDYYADAFLVPHDDGRTVCALQFTTPCVEDGSAVSVLYEAIARTLRIFHPDDPTTFAEPATT